MTIKFYLYYRVNILIINDLLSGVAALNLRHFDLQEKKNLSSPFTFSPFYSQHTPPFLLYLGFY